MIQTPGLPLHVTQTVAAEAMAVKLPLTLNLELGQMLLARVGQARENGLGYFLLPDGNRLTFTGGQALTEGELVRLQVARLAPEVTVRVLASETGTAQNLAQGAEQSLTRAPELFRRLLELAGFPVRGGNPPTTPSTSSSGATPASTPATTTTGGAPLSLSPQGVATVLNTATQLSPSPSFIPLPASFGQRPAPTLQSGGLGFSPSVAASFVTGKGESLLDVFRSALPSVTAEGLLRGDMSELAKVFEGDFRRPPAETVRMLRQAAAQLQPSEDGDGSGLRAPGRGGESEASLGAARAALNRLADLVASQEVLPRGLPLPDGGLLLGYRAFWLPEGGFGEAIWKREGEGTGGRGEDGEAKFTTVMLALEMTRLGPIQARLTHGENQLQVGIAAADEEALAALRARIGELRNGLHDQGLPLRSLDLMRLTDGEMQSARMAALGLGGGFVTEA